MRVSPASGFFYACLLVVTAFLLANFSVEHGFTRLSGFGENQSNPRLPDAQDVYVKPGTGGYDGQFYAQVALDPSLQHPQLEEALDTPFYRARRIGMPAAAWLAGLGQSSWVLQTFPLLNVAAWFFLASYLKRKLGGLTDAESCARWFGCMFAVGVLDSLRLSLTDLPSAVFILLALYGFEKGAQRVGMLHAAVAVLIKETSILVMLARIPESLDWRKWVRYVAGCVLVLLPLVLWLLYLTTRYEIASGTSGNFALPFVSMYEFAHEIVFEKISAGEASVHDYFGLLAILSGLLQAGVCVWYFNWRDPWWRVGAPFALLFLVAGPYVWESTMAPLRIVLPLTFIVCLKMPRNRFFFPLLLLISLPTAHGIIRWVFNL